MKSWFFLAGLSLLTTLTTRGQYADAPLDKPPLWAKDVIWYQIFVERFYNADKNNDPKPANIQIPALDFKAPEGWTITPWTGNWYELDPWAAKMNKPFNNILQYRRYGGDLQGVISKLDYLQQLGVTALFLNPVNNAPSLHKYDASHYHHIDVNFGPDPAGDMKIIASENPADPRTWKWTSADKMFLKLVEEVHKRKMKIIMDFSWNHTGTTFWAWEDILKNQAASPYKDWFAIKTFDDPSTPQNEFTYAGWAGVPSLPELRKVDITTERINGLPYEGDIDYRAKQHIMDVARRWLAPNNVVGNGIDGFRLDVAEQVGLGFWRDFRLVVRSIQPQAYLVGEIWWEKWPDKLTNPAPYTKGDVFDAVTFYHPYRWARYFFAKNDFAVDAPTLRDSLQMQWNRLRPETVQAMMNVTSSHDAPRLLSDFYNTNKYKYKALPTDDPAYKTGKPDKETYTRLKLYLMYEYTSPGAPNIWNGEEMGMWGADDPFNRKPLMWQEFKFQPESRSNFQPGPKEFDPVAFNQELFDHYKNLVSVRKSHPALRSANIEFIVAEGKKLGYRRWDDKEEILVYFNVDAGRQSFTLPGKGPYVNLLSGKQIKGGSLNLSSLQGVILKVVK